MTAPSVSLSKTPGFLKIIYTMTYGPSPIEAHINVKLFSQMAVKVEALLATPDFRKKLTAAAPSFFSGSNSIVAQANLNARNLASALPALEICKKNNLKNKLFGLYKTALHVIFLLASTALLVAFGIAAPYISIGIALQMLSVHIIASIYHRKRLVLHQNYVEKLTLKDFIISPLYPAYEAFSKQRRLKAYIAHASDLLTTFYSQLIEFIEKDLYAITNREIAPPLQNIINEWYSHR